MLGKITKNSTAQRQPVDSQVEIALSTSYLVNADYIIDMVDQTSYRDLRYKFNVYDDKQTDLYIAVSDTAAAINTLADATANSQMISLNVFEGIQSFNQVTGLTAVETTFNVAAIVWGEDDPTGAYSRIWYLTGGGREVPVIVDHNIAQIVDLADTGGTTTTTSSTSSTSTSTTSTSSTSTTSTSTTSTTTVA